MIRLLLTMFLIAFAGASGCATTESMFVQEEPKVILAVEIGSKGVKGKLFSARANKSGSFNIQELSVQKDINTNITDGFDETKNPLLKPEKIVETTNAVSNLVQEMKNEYNISMDNIHIFGSSALIKAKNADALFSSIAEQTQKQVQFISVKDEVFYGFINNVPPEMQDRALIVDIGSGNTKLGYYDPRTKNSRSVDLPYGTKSFLQNVVKKNGLVLLQPDDVKDAALLISSLTDYRKGSAAGSGEAAGEQQDHLRKLRSGIMESVLEQLSADTHADIVRYVNAADSNIPPRLMESLIFDLNRIILENDRLAANFYTELFPTGVEQNFPGKNRAILDAVLPLRKAQQGGRIPNLAFDTMSRIVIRERLREKLRFNSDLKERKQVYFAGGIIWAFVTLTHPEAVDKEIVPFTYDEVVRFMNSLAADPEKLFSVNRLINDHVSSQAFKEIQKIKQSVFTVDELSSGISILKSTLEELGLASSTVYFVRDGGWYKGAILSKLDSSFFINTKKAGSSEQNFMSRDTDEGIFEKDGRIYIKVKDRSVISLIDEIAYKLRANYTVLDDLSRYSLTIFDNCERDTNNMAFIRANWAKVKSRSFGSIEELLDLLNAMKDSNGKRINIQYARIGDGIVFKKARKTFNLRATDVQPAFVDNLLQAVPNEAQKNEGPGGFYLKIREELGRTNADLKRMLEERQVAPFSGQIDPLPEKVAEGLNYLLDSGYFSADSLQKEFPEFNFPGNQQKECATVSCKSYLNLLGLFPNDLAYRDVTAEEDYPNSYKKVFLNSITTKDAEEALKKLYFAHEKEFTLVSQQAASLNMSSSNALLSLSSGAPSYPMAQFPQTSQSGQSARYESFEGARLANDAVISIPSQNALIIKARQEVLSLMGDTIASLDAKYPQVLVETKVFEVDNTTSKQIGAALDYSKTNGATNYGIKTILQEGLSASTLPLFFYKYTEAEKKLALLTNLVMNDQRGLVKILAEPRIAMKPGEEAAVGLNTVKYVSIQGVQTSDLKGVETGITFKITPIILSENKISLRLTIEQSEFIPSNETNVTLSTNKNTIYTTVIADDGELISIGGIDTRRYSNLSAGIPFLKDIPLLGSLFSSKSKVSNNTKIEFMIKPTIKKLSTYQKMNPIDMMEERESVDKDSAANLKFFVQ